MKRFWLYRAFVVSPVLLWAFASLSAYPKPIPLIVSTAGAILAACLALAISRLFREWGHSQRRIEPPVLLLVAALAIVAAVAFPGPAHARPMIDNEPKQTECEPLTIGAWTFDCLGRHSRMTLPDGRTIDLLYAGDTVRVIGVRKSGGVFELPPVAAACQMIDASAANYCLRKPKLISDLDEWTPSGDMGEHGVSGGGFWGGGGGTGGGIGGTGGGGMSCQNACDHANDVGNAACVPIGMAFDDFTIISCVALVAAYHISCTIYCSYNP